MEWLEAKDAALSFFACGIAAFVVYELRLLRESVERLNEKMAVVISDLGQHERRIEKLEERSQ